MVEGRVGIENRVEVVVAFDIGDVVAVTIGLGFGDGFGIEIGTVVEVGIGDGFRLRFGNEVEAETGVTVITGIKVRVEYYD